MSRPELPTGTVTFLFTDVEGSTRLLQEHGAGYADLLDEHRRALREAFTGHDGVEVDTQGDAFFVAFSRAADAVAAAAEARQALEPGPIRVRMGIHTGEPIVTDEGYVGIDVHRAARIAAAAHGGQIVLSETTRGLLDSDSADSRSRRAPAEGPDRSRAPVPARRRRLPAAQDARRDQPARRREPARRERARARRARRARSRTARASSPSPGLEAPGRPASRFRSRRSSSARCATASSGCRSRASPTPSSCPRRSRRRSGRATTSPASSAGRSSSSCSTTSSTSSTPLRRSALSSRPRAACACSSRAGRPCTCPASRSTGWSRFRRAMRPRSSSSGPVSIGRELAPDATVEAICRRLDGLPLAVELAAARTKLLAPEPLLERLDSALPLLTGGARDAPERQRTLRATIEWSYDLLDAGSKELFARLSVFAGSFPLAAAEEVCDADLDGIAALVDSSLLKPIGDDRFLMLETIREYALERLAGSAGRRGASAAARGVLLRARRAGVRAAVRRRGRVGRRGSSSTTTTFARRSTGWRRTMLTRALELAGALGWFWLSHGLLAEGCGRLARALADSPATGRSQARALTAVGIAHGPARRRRRGASLAR